MCHYSIWVNEEIDYNGRARHADCKEAICDNTPRILDYRYSKATGIKGNKSKIRKQIKWDRKNTTLPS